MVARTFRSGLTVLWLTLLVATAQARPLDLEQARQLALSTSPVLEEYRARLAEARYRVDEAYTVVNPTLSLTGGYTYLTPTIQTRFSGQSITVTVPDNFQTGLSLRQALFTFGRLEWSAATTELAEQTARCELSRENARVIEEVSLAFIEALLGQEEVVIAEDNLKSRQAHLEDARKLLGVGAAARFDVIRDEAALSKAQSELLEARNRRDLTRARLLILLGQPDLGDLELVQLPELLPAPPPSLEESRTQAFRERPELRAADWAVQAARARVELADAQDNPSLYFQTDFNVKTATTFQTPYLWTIGLNLAVPLFDGGLSDAKVGQAQQVVHQLEAILRNVQRSVALEVESFYLDLHSRRARVEVAEATLAQAQEAARIARLRYQNGLSTNVELLDAEATLTQARLGLTQARYLYLAAEQRWQRAVPAPSEEQP